MVTPCMGVWIEIVHGIPDKSIIAVTPCMGVWIEIINSTNDAPQSFRHSLYGSVD